MKTLLCTLILFVSTSAHAWGPYGPYGPYGPGYGMGYGYGGYGMGYIPFIPGPSFNYTIQQSPPIIVNNNDQQPRVVERVIEQPPKVIYKDRYCDKRCFEDQYSK